MVNRGNALCGLEKFNEALEAFEQAKKLDPFSTIVLDNMSLVLQALDRKEAAKAASEKAKRLTLLEMVDHSSSYIDSSDP
jgi:tetratricopeptide (TPR) repeat protein